jgi:hypothetical protein
VNASLSCGLTSGTRALDNPRSHESRPTDCAQDIIVATSRSQAGRLLLKWVQPAVVTLRCDGEVIIGVEAVGYRSVFVGTVLASLPGGAAACLPDGAEWLTR